MTPCRSSYIYVHKCARRQPNKNSRGFTLLEVLLGIALLSIVFAMSYPLYVNVAHQGDLDIATRSIEVLLRKAIMLSSAVENDSEWGVYFDQPYTILFLGSSYAARDSSYDEITELPNYEMEGELEYVFERVTGDPLQPGSTIFTNEYTGQSLELNVNEKGLITIQ